MAVDGNLTSILQAHCVQPSVPGSLAAVFPVLVFVPAAAQGGGCLRSLQARD